MGTGLEMYQVLGQCQFGWCKQIKLPPLGSHSTLSSVLCVPFVNWPTGGKLGIVALFILRILTPGDRAQCGYVLS